MTRTLTLALLSTLVLSSCSAVDRVLPRGNAASAVALPFRATLSRSPDDRRNFAVSVNAPGATLDEVRESARFPATRYCLETYGGSPVDWVIDPATGDWAVIRTEGGLSVAGRCVAR